MIRRLANVLLLMIFVGSVGLGDEPGTPAAKRPSILLILADDLAWSDLGCYGHAWHRTPHIDRLAASGMRFTQAYSPAPICSAARASILTGKTVARLGFEFVTKSEPGKQVVDADVPLETPPLTINLPLSETTLAESMSPLGYQTAYFGKWHVSQHHRNVYQAWHPQFGPSRQGFQFAVEDFGSHPYGWTKAEKANPSATPVGEFAEDSLVDKIAAFLASDHDEPYFAFASSFHVHTPVKNQCRWLVQEYDQRIPVSIPQRARRLEYAAFVETFDHHVGRLLDAVAQSGQADNTIVIFFSDNGGHPQFTANGPLRGSKWNLYEGGIRVPMLVRWPGITEPGSRCDVPTVGYDLMPTLIEMAGGNPDSVSHHMDGVSIVPALSGKPIERDDPLVWHFPYYHPEAKFGDAKTAIGTNDFAISQTRPHSAMRAGDYKVICFAEDDRNEVYDLQADPGEQVDLSDSRPELASRLNRQLHQTLEGMNARWAAPKRKRTSTKGP